MAWRKRRASQCAESRVWSSRGGVWLGPFCGCKSASLFVPRHQGDAHAALNLSKAKRQRWLSTRRTKHSRRWWSHLLILEQQCTWVANWQTEGDSARCGGGGEALIFLPCFQLRDEISARWVGRSRYLALVGKLHSTHDELSFRASASRNLSFEMELHRLRRSEYTHPTPSKLVACVRRLSFSRSTNPLS